MPPLLGKEKFERKKGGEGGGGGSKMTQKNRTSFMNDPLLYIGGM